MADPFDAVMQKYGSAAPVGQDDGFSALMKKYSAPTPIAPVEQTATPVETTKPTNARANALGAVAEPVMNLLSGMVAKPIGEVAGLAALAKDLISGNKNGDPEGFKRHVQDSLTYSPRTQAGKDVTTSDYNPVNILGNAIGGVSKQAGNLVRTGTPLTEGLGNAIQEAVPQGLGLLGARQWSVPKAEWMVNNPVVKGLEHLFEKQDIRTGRLFNSVVHDDPAAISLLRNPPQNLSPGSAPTVGEMLTPLGYTEASALEKFAGKRYMDSQYNAKNLARDSSYVDTLRTVGGRGADDTAYNQAIKDRSAVTGPHYNAADESKARVSSYPVYDVASGILAKNKNIDTISKPMRDILDKLNIETGKGVAFETNPGQLIALSKDIGKKMTAKTINGTAEFDVASLAKVKDILDNQIAKKVPDYSVAQSTFADMSNIPNRMDVGARLEALLNPALNDFGGSSKLRGEAYAKGLANEQKLIQDSIGFKRGDDLSKILPPNEMGLLGGIGKDLGRRGTNEAMASSGSSGLMRILGDNVTELPIPQLWSRKISIANFIKNTLQGNANEAALQTAAKYMIDNPAEIANLMEKASAVNKQRLSAMMINKHPSSLISPYVAQQGAQQ